MFLQGTIIPALFKSSIGPDLVLTLTLVITLIKGRQSGIICAVLLGLYQDLLIGQYIGINIAILVGLVIFVDYVGQFLFKNSVLTPLIVVASSSIMRDIVFLVIIYALGFKMPFSLLIVRKVLIMSVLNAIIGAFIYRLGYDNRRDSYGSSINF